MLTRSPTFRLARALALLLAAALLGVAPAPAGAMPVVFTASLRSSAPAAPPPHQPPPTAQDSGIHPTDAITPTVSAGGSHTCGLKSDGQVVCWGYDADGQVSGVPNAIFTHISAGESHSCGIQSDGTLACWGRNAEAQVAPVPSGTFKDVSAGGSHSCGVKTDGTLACWGDNSSGQLDNIPSGTFTQVSAGGIHSCGLKTDGSIVCWGNNDAGQREPVPAGPFNQVSAGFLHSCGLKTDGAIVCWGNNDAGQREPVPVGPFSQVSAGNMHSCGVKSNNFYCWGKNDQGQAVNHIAPTITLEPTDKTIFAKNSLTLSAAASGSPAPIYQWRRNGTPIPGATNAVYTVLKASSADSGLYDVVVDNIMGSDTSNSVVVTVNRLSQALGFAPLNKVPHQYGDSRIELMATASSLLPVTFSVIAGPATITGRFLTITGAGTVAVRVEQPGDEFYTAAPPLTQAFTVARAPLTIRANDQVRLLGAPPPPLTATYIGLVNGDTPESLDRRPILTSLAALGSPPGEYPIVIIGAADANYQITLINGTMRIVRYQVHAPIVFRQ